uniref:Ion transport domain-containing protein n=1 Tax=Anopheles coluzzii TaxID=1518534 RepID=A0A8W7PGN7_ANOCL
MAATDDPVVPPLSHIVSSKLGMSGPQLGQSISQQGFFSSRDSLSASGTSRPLHSHVSATTSEMDLSRKDRKRERSKLKAADPPLLGSWSRTGPRESNANAMGPCATTRASTNHLAAAPCGTGSTCNGADRYIFGRRSGCSTTSRKSNGRRWSFVFDPAGRLCYYWSMVVSMAFLYNFWVIIYRFAFQEINGESIVLWFCLDYFSDFLYLVDILFHFRTGYLEDGVLQTDSTKLRQHYMNSTTFYIDCLCLLPLDFLYLSIGFNSILRSFRLVKIYRFWAFMDRTERHTNYPNLFRSTSLIHYLLVIFHWNGCLYHIIYKNNGFGSKNWVYHDSESADVVKQYLQSYYWCTLALTTIGDLPRPRSKAEYVFVIAQLLFGLMLFATVLGHVANIVTSVSAARKEFQEKMRTQLGFGRRSGCSTTSRKSNGRRWSFVFDPAGRLCYYWSMVVSMAFLYNFWVIIYRFAFQEINGESIVLWFCLDYFSDFLYLVDILFHFRTGYLEDGVLQTDSTKLRQHYMNSTTFYIDCLCLLPLDFLYLSIGFNSILRSFRLVKIYRFWAFMDRTERHTNYPNLFRSTSLIHYLLVIFHWNGCLYHIIYKNNVLLANDEERFG